VTPNNWRAHRQLEFIVAPIALTLTIGMTSAAWRLASAVDQSALTIDPAKRAVLVTGVFPNALAAFVGPERPFEAMARVDVGRARYRAGTLAGRVVCLETTASLFSIVAVRPIAGRTFRREDEASAEGIALLTDAFSRSRFGQAQNALGHLLSIQDTPHRVVGVIGSDLDVFGGAEIVIVKRQMIPAQIVDSSTAEDLTISGVLMRLHDGVSAAMAFHVLKIAGVADRRLGVALSVTELVEALRGQFGSLQTVLRAGVCLLTACGLSTIMLLCAGSVHVKSRQVALQLALGARLRHILGPHLKEGIRLAAISCAAGLIVGAEIPKIVALAFPQFGHFVPVGIDPRAWSMIAVAGAVACMGSVAAVSVWPIAAWRSRGTELTRLLNNAEPRSGLLGAMSGQRGWMAIQIGCSVALFGCAVVFCRISLNEWMRDRGFKPDRLLVFDLAQPADNVVQSIPSSPAERQMRRSQYESRTNLFYSDILNGLSSLPGLAAVAATSRVPMSQIGSSGQFVDGGNARRGLLADVIEVAGDFFGAIGVQVKHGKPFDERATAETEWCAVVTESVAQRLWAETNPIGQALRINRGRPRTVVATIHRMDVTGLGRDFPGQVFVPSQQPVYFARNDLSVVLRLNPGARIAAGDLRKVIDRASPGTLIHGLRPGRELLTTALRPLLAQTALSITLTAVMLVLSCLGMVGAVRQWMLDRNQEMQIRVILGATPATLARRTVWQASGVLFAGIAIGLLIAFWGARVIGTGLVGARFTVLDVLPGVAIAVMIVVSISYLGAMSAASNLRVTRQ